MSLGKNIKEIRKIKGLSLTKLSQITGLSRTTITEIENTTNDRSPTTATLNKIAAALEISVDELFKENNEDYLDKLNDKEVVELYEAMQKNDQLKIFYKKTKDLTPKDLRLILRIVEEINSEDE